MDGRTTTFLIFIAFSLSSLAAGYAARKRRWLSPDHSRAIHMHTVLWFWSPVALISFWRLPLRGDGAVEVLKIMAAQPILMVAAAALMALALRPLKITRRQQGVLILGAGLSNHGFTMGAYLAYALLQPPELALGYGIAFVSSMQLFMILIFYPVAHHYGSDTAGPIGRVIAGSFLTPQAAPLYTSLLGVALNLAGVPPPGWLDTYRLLDILFFAGAAGAWAGIGLILRLGDTLTVWRLHILLALLQFAVHPLLTVGLLAAFGAASLPIADLPTAVVFLQSFMPTALNTVMVANLFRLDARLAGVLWLWNTLAFCLLILPPLLWLAV